MEERQIQNMLQLDVDQGKMKDRQMVGTDRCGQTDGEQKYCQKASKGLKDRNG